MIMEVAERHHISPLLVATAVVTRLPHYTKHGKKAFQELLDKDMTTLAHHFQLFKKDPTKHRQMGSPLRPRSKQWEPAVQTRTRS